MPQLHERLHEAAPRRQGAAAAAGREGVHTVQPAAAVHRVSGEQVQLKRGRQPMQSMCQRKQKRVICALEGDASAGGGAPANQGLPNVRQSETDERLC